MIDRQIEIYVSLLLSNINFNTFKLTLCFYKKSEQRNVLTMSDRIKNENGLVIMLHQINL